MSHISRCRGALIFSASAALLVGLVTPAVVADAATAPRAMVTMSSDVVPHIAKLEPVSAHAASARMEVDLLLKRPDRAGEANLERQLYTRGSALYHNFLTPAEFAARFGVSPETEAAASHFATAHGLKVVKVDATRDDIALSGTTAQVEKTFSVRVEDYRLRKTAFYANREGPTVPAGLGIEGVIGMDNLLRSAPASMKPQSSTPGQTMCTGNVCTGLTTPQDLWSDYDMPSTDMGQGQMMAIFGEGQTDPVIANLRTFETVNNLPEVPVNVIHADGPNADYSDDSGEDEWDLDTQASTGMSPDVLAEDLYFGSSLTDASTLNVLDAWASDPNGPLQASASYGECELNPLGSQLNGAPSTDPGYAGSAGLDYTTSYEAGLEMAVDEGRTLFSSAGDTGSSCPQLQAPVVGAGNGVVNQGAPIPNYPASSPHVVGVGGTVLYGQSGTPSAGRSLEYAWTFTGGGPSQVFAEPSFQDGITTIATPCTTDEATGQPYAGEVPPEIPPTCRGVPDIAAQSGDVVSNGYAIVYDGETDYPGAGTSLSSPLSLGMWTRIQAASPKSTSSQGGNGFADYTYYHQALVNQATDDRDFFDVGGTSDSVVTNNGYFASLPRTPTVDPTGWDYVSGLGVPDVGNLETDVDGKQTPTDNVLPPPPTNTGGGGGTTPPVDVACVPLFTGAPGADSYLDGSNDGGNPQLDIVQGDMHTVQIGGTTYLQTIMTMQNLSYTQAEAVPGGVPTGTANIYYFLWEVNGTTYYTSAEVDIGTTTASGVVYGNGTLSGTMYTEATGTSDLGSFNTGPNGTVVVDVPLTVANTGAVSPGSVLTAPAAQTKVEIGSSVTGGLLEAADSAGPTNNYTLGEICGATGAQGSSGGSGPPSSLPEAPLGVLFPVAAVVVLGGGTLVRRRQRARATRP